MAAKHGATGQTQSGTSGLSNSSGQVWARLDLQSSHSFPDCPKTRLHPPSPGWGDSGRRSTLREDPGSPAASAATGQTMAPEHKAAGSQWAEQWIPPCSTGRNASHDVRNETGPKLCLLTEWHLSVAELEIFHPQIKTSVDIIIREISELSR